MLAGDYPEYSVLRHKPTPPSRAELDLKAGGLPFGAAVWTDGRSSGRPMLEVYLRPSRLYRAKTQCHTRDLQVPLQQARE